MAMTLARTPVARPLARGVGWGVSEVVCTLGPQDRPFEERHSGVTIAAVLSGTFQYRHEAGRSLLYPGAFMLGNPGTCFQCGHEHGAGDRCFALQFAADYFDEIAAGVTGDAGFRFRPGMLPAIRPMAAPLAAARAQVARGDALAAEEAAVALAEGVIRNVSGAAAPDPRPSARDQRRLSIVLRFIEERSRDALDLDRLAALARMSKYHFLRVFRRALGVTPHQLLLHRRLARAAEALRAGGVPVATIAYDEGFGDLSTFNAQFRRAFGAAPLEFRRRA